jgi:hypothetical protein
LRNWASNDRIVVFKPPEPLEVPAVFLFQVPFLFPATGRAVAGEWVFDERPGLLLLFAWNIRTPASTRRRMEDGTSFP